MKVKNRRSLLDEYQVLCGLSEDPMAGDFREDVGHFVISYIEQNGRAPSNKEIVNHCIPNSEFLLIDKLREDYKDLISGKIDEKTYQNKLKKYEREEIE